MTKYCKNHNSYHYIENKVKNEGCPNCTKLCHVITCTITRYSVKNSARLELSIQSYGKKTLKEGQYFIYSKNEINRLFEPNSEKNHRIKLIFSLNIL